MRPDLGAAGTCCLHGKTAPFLFHQPEKHPLEHQVFLLLPGFCGPTDRKRVFWWGGPVSAPHTPVGLFVQCVSPFCAEKLGLLFFPYSGVLPDFLVFRSRCIPGRRKNPHKIPRWWSCAWLNSKEMGVEMGQFPPLQGGENREKGWMWWPWILCALISATIFIDY